MANWIRRLEFVSLTITTWIFPLTFIITSLFLIFYVIPIANNASLFYSLLNYTLIVTLFLLGITWNTRFGVGGVAFMLPFKNYLKHQETKDDRVKAIIGVFFWPWIVIGLIGLFIRLFS